MSSKAIIGIIVLALICLGVGFLTGMEYKAYQIRQAVSEVFGGGSNSSDTKTGAPKTATPSAASTIIEKNIGEEVRLTTIAFKVNSSSEVESYSVPFGSPIAPKPGTKLVVVNLDFTNISKEPYYFGGHKAGSLIDNQNRVFNPHDEFLGDKGVAGDLAPNITKIGDVLFEIPADATGYSFLWKPNANEEYRIRLK